MKELVQLLYGGHDKVGQVIGGVDEVLFLLYGYSIDKVLGEVTWVQWTFCSAKVFSEFIPIITDQDI